MSIGGHHSPVAMTVEWLTPPHVVDSLGPFDLDPCAPVDRPWDTAKKHYTISDDGLKQPWSGRVWCNPPYGLAAADWLARCVQHGNAVALVFARTETKMFFDHVWPKANGLLFLKGRLHFHHVTGARAKANSGAPSVLIAYGVDNAIRLQTCSLPGKFIQINHDGPTKENGR